MYLVHHSKSAITIHWVFLFFFFQSRGKDLRWFPISSSSYLVAPWTWEMLEAVAFYFCSLMAQAFKKTQIFLLPVGPRFQKTSNISARHWPKGSKKPQIILKYFKNNFISSIFGCTGSLSLHMGFPCSEWGLLFAPVFRLLTGGGFSWLWSAGSRHSGLVVRQHVESSQARDRTCVPCIGRQILIH